MKPGRKEPGVTGQQELSQRAQKEEQGPQAQVSPEPAVRIPLSLDYLIAQPKDTSKAE